MKLDELNGEGDGSDLKTDFDDILNQATEEELVDLAGKQHNGRKPLLYLLYFMLFEQRHKYILYIFQLIHR